jgi:hypothetical protein
MPTTRRWILIAAALLFSSCARPPAVRMPAQARDESAQVSPTPIRLPATWTPTVTPVEAPPTATRTPLSTDEPGGSRTPLITMPVLSTEVVTPVPYDANWNGWQLVDASRASFQLPASYEVMDLGEGFGEFFKLFTEILVTGFSEMAGEFEGGSELLQTPFPNDEIEDALDFDLIVAVEEDLMTSVFFASEPLESSDTLDSLLYEAISSQESPGRILSRQLIADAPYQMARAFVEVRDQETGMAGKQVIYVIIEGRQGFTLSYQTTAQAFDGLLPLFEKSVSSLKIK